MNFKIFLIVLLIGAIITAVNYSDALTKKLKEQK